MRTGVHFVQLRLIISIVAVLAKFSLSSGSGRSSGPGDVPTEQILTYRRGGVNHHRALCHEHVQLVQADPLGGPAGGGRYHPVLFAGGMDFRGDLLGPAPRYGPAP